MSASKPERYSLSLIKPYQLMCSFTPTGDISFLGKNKQTAGKDRHFLFNPLWLCKTSRPHKCEVYPLLDRSSVLFEPG